MKMKMMFIIKDKLAFAQIGFTDDKPMLILEFPHRITHVLYHKDDGKVMNQYISMNEKRMNYFLMKRPYFFSTESRLIITTYFN